jgi:hypothetical protein
MIAFSCKLTFTENAEQIIPKLRFVRASKIVKPITSSILLVVCATAVFAANPKDDSTGEFGALPASAGCVRRTAAVLPKLQQWQDHRRRNQLL